MASLMVFRLDPKVRRRVRRIARRRRVSQSQLAREALVALVEREEAAERPYDLVADLIGSVRSGDPKLSENMGKKLTELLNSRRKRS